MCTRRSMRRAALAVAFASLGLLPAYAVSSEINDYRGFRLGTPLSAVAVETAVPAADIRTVVERPVLIQELVWRPPSVRTSIGESARDTVAQVLFGFLNGELYRIVVSYDPDRTEGMTDQDLIEALSAQYGASRKPLPPAVVIMSSASQGYDDEQPEIARWETADASVSLFHGRYRSAFGLVIVSKSLAPKARTGLATGLRLAMLDAPRRQAAEDLARLEAENLVHARARVANKAAFKY